MDRPISDPLTNWAGDFHYPPFEVASGIDDSVVMFNGIDFDHATLLREHLPIGGEHAVV
jgi:hypothetical protein